MKAPFSLVLALAAAGSARAQDLQIAVRVYSGGSWLTSIDAQRGSTVRVGVLMSGDSSIFGMGGATLRLTGTGAVAGDAVRFAEGTSTGRVAPFTFGAATNAIFRDDASSFRIDDASDVLNINGSGGMTFFQRDPATAVPGTFSTANPAVCIMFDIDIAANSPDREIVMTLDQLSRGLAAYYTASNASRPATAAAVLSAGVIRIGIPAPSSAAILGLAGLAARRRR